jgi:predicted nuclease with TOPRIM domain
MLSFIIEELKGKFRTLRGENIKLHEELKEMKTELQNLKTTLTAQHSDSGGYRKGACVIVKLLKKKTQRFT